MSPHLHFGEIGPREIWHATRRFALQRGQHTSWRESDFLRELGWREFAHHLLFHFPDTPEQPLRARYAAFPWKSNAIALKDWQRGMTGYPIVDAGMRELWQTGWMHNRVRMLVASFLVKDLLLPWTEGARWFWDTLVDADLAQQHAWMAMGGRLRRRRSAVLPDLQSGVPGKKVRSRRYVRAPLGAGARPNWRTNGCTDRGQAPAAELRSAGVILGRTYPHPIVDHEASRMQALDAYGRIKARGGSTSGPIGSAN